MSKPKPGLGKVVRRTIKGVTNPSQSLNHNTTPSQSTQTYYSTASTSTSTNVKSPRRDFISLGIPPTRNGVGWDTNNINTDDIVKPFLTRGRTESSYIKGKSKGQRGISTLSPAFNPLTHPGNGGNGWISHLDVPIRLLTSLTSLSNLSSSPGANKPLWFFNQSQGDHVDIISIPESPPSGSLRLNGRTSELTPALSPFTHSTLELNLSSFSSGFNTIGVPPTAYVPETNPSIPTLTSSSQLYFHLGASGSAKERPVYKPNLRRSNTPPPPHRPRSFPLPKIDPPDNLELKSVGIGEDAYFIRSDGMCVADGVGGWASSGKNGADAGRWSRLLTHFCEREVDLWQNGKSVYAMDQSSLTSNSKGNQDWTKKVWEAGGLKFSTGAVARKRKSVDPIEIMQRGYEKCLSCFTAEGIHGSSTCLLALLHNSTLSIANVGDCCLLLIRGDEIIFRTDEMQHAFNFPLQLGTHSRDEPMKDAKRYDVGVGKGDVVVLGSDGLMDNLFDEDILETLAQFAPPLSTTNTDSDLAAFSPQAVSEELCRRARIVSETVSATTPFMVRAIEEGIDFVGGKKDDISVVVGVIGDRDGEQDGLALHTG